MTNEHQKPTSVPSINNREKNKVGVLYVGDIVQIDQDFQNNHSGIRISENILPILKKGDYYKVTLVNPSDDSKEKITYTLVKVKNETGEVESNFFSSAIHIHLAKEHLNKISLVKNTSK